MSKKQVSFFQLMSEAGEELQNKENVWTKHPRPQFCREEWYSLNGMWELDGHPIRVPFVPESRLSGYQGNIKESMTYRKRFQKPDFQKYGRVLLHFQAVDQIAKVFLNDICLGEHEGGYAPFSFDITDVLAEGDNYLEVKVIDELDYEYPYGKQCKKRGGMWYTPTSGIWQSVWLEHVPDVYVNDLKLTPDMQGVRIQCNRNIPEAADESLLADIFLHTGEVHRCELNFCEDYLDLSKIVTQTGETYIPKLWNPDAPFLYQMVLHAGEDIIKTYFALRTVEIREIDTVPRVCLNGKPIFMHGVLDQGYFCDGIVTPAEEEEYERDILRMKELGINMLRKHIKIEPEWFYYYCDKHGMLVMQDMVSSGKYSFIRDTALPTIGLQRRKDRGKRMSIRQKMLFEKHMIETLELLYNHPCIIAYTIFNEGWGQFESDRLYALAKETDPTRLYDATSGWFAQKDSDFDSVHIYFGAKRPKIKERPVFLSEFGGYSYLVEDHVYTNKSYGYGTCKNTKELMTRLVARYEELVLPYIKAGLCGSIYTQISDVEDEINGLYTYDRRICKVDKDAMLHLAGRIRREIEADGVGR